MTDDPARRAIASALDRLAGALATPRALAPSADDRAALAEALNRARAQLLAPSEPVLTVALAGGTGAGKSTLINALAGEAIADMGEIRPTTRQIQVYHHRNDTPGELVAELAGRASFVPHDRPELRQKMLVDSPDLDSFVIQHRATTRALLKRAGLVLYVFSPERYLEERTWSVLRQETEFSGCAAVLNKADRVGSPADLEIITADLRERFAALGLASIRIFRISALAHLPGRAGSAVEADPGPSADEMPLLRDFLERELQASEIARLLRRQRRHVVDHLRAIIDRIAPESLPARLDEAIGSVSPRAEAAAEALAGDLAGALGAVEAELAPLVTLRRHERFWGPFRVWLAVTDFIGFGLASLARHFLGQRSTDRKGQIENLLSRASLPAAEDRLRAEAYALQDLLYSRGLPVGRWRAGARVDGPKLIAEVAAEVEAHFDVTSARIEGWRQGVISTASTLGALFPAILVLVGLFVMGRDVVIGSYVGLPILWHLVGMIVLFFLALQGTVDLLLPRGSHWLGTGFGSQAVRRVLTRTLDGWISTYRDELTADVADLREPLATLQAAVSGDATISPPAPLPESAPRRVAEARP